MLGKPGSTPEPIVRQIGRQVRAFGPGSPRRPPAGCHQEKSVSACIFHGQRSLIYLIRIAGTPPAAVSTDVCNFAAIVALFS